MFNIVINVWGPKVEDAAAKLAAVGVKSFEYVEPWKIPPRPDNLWAFRVQLDKRKNPCMSSTETALVVGWILGVIGVPMSTVVDHEITPVVG